MSPSFIKVLANVIPDLSLSDAQTIRYSSASIVISGNVQGLLSSIMSVKLQLFKEISSDPLLSSLRINFEGGERKFSDLFFKSFFAALDKSLFLDQAIN